MLQVSVLASRILLAAVFAVSGVAKLATRARTRDSLVEFGVPVRFAGISAVGLVLAELTVTALLLPITTAWYGGAGALALLIVFCTAIAANLALHRKPRCNCFGQLHSEPIGWSTLARNLGFGVIAGIVVWGGRDPNALSILGWTHSLATAASVTLALSVGNFILLIGMAAFLIQIMRQQGRLLLRLEAVEQGVGIKNANAPDAAAAPQSGLPLGTPAPTFELNALDGGRTTLGGLLKAQKPVLLLFSNPNCGPCQALLPDFAGWQSDLAEDSTFGLIAEGTAAENRAKLGPFGIRTVLLQEDREVAESYQAWGTPAAVLIAPDGMIASYVAQGGDAIRTLVGSLKQQSRFDKPAIPVGDPAPDLKLQSLWGESVALSDVRERETLLLFWNPDCGFCRKMLPDLRAWEAEASPDAPQLLVISTGDVSENRAMGLRSMVVLDTESRAAHAFAAHGTPMAVLLDSDGRVASRVAAGAQAVFALAKPRDGSESSVDLALRRA
ncbi:MAG: MauE/DoxX family redox-associated membrane protein [Terracidiphilus sp.]